MTPKNIRPSRQYLEAIARSNDVLVARTEPNTSARRAFGKAALSMFERRSEGSEYLDMDTQAFRLIGLYDEAVETGLRLDSADANPSLRMTRAEKLPLIRKTLKFNHAIRELIDTHPELTTGDVLQFFNGLDLYLPESSQSLDRQDYLRGILRGMQHEVVAEQALWSIPEVEDVIQASIEEELQGIDLKVVYRGQVYCLDIKSTSYSETKALNTRFSGNKSVPVWTGLTATDLEGRFRGSESQIKIVAERLLSAIDPQEIAEITG